MGIFSKKKVEKKEDSLPPPPPPMPPREVGDIEPIRPVEPREPMQVPNLSIPELPMEKEEPVEEPAFAPRFPAVPEERKAPPVTFHEEKEEHKGPFFVSVGDYEKIELDVNSIKTLLGEADDTLKVLNDSLVEEDKLFGKWRSFIEGVEKKLAFVDKVIEKTGE